ncbi:hypothetical protein Pla110_44160 [Polystyrenella longa]|uniref:Cyclic-phosphate processing Receiver domain-containing protein n=1 Tax=Polystyrenella longa TaxID=2528007 RepID=A0A518CTW0_9PLAN|nr:cyclic-phosphate processing receiver domain-containing protein [Polystyrenella longa]QDU82655.1 hypothetical protein Pla110_44160 [Polystyrenella longa]
MKVYLDDERPTPDGWVSARWPEDVISLLKSGRVTHISLDHDLGDDKHGTGYDVLKWIEREVATASFDPPEISIHTSNVSARQKMQLAVSSIKRFTGK